MAFKRISPQSWATRAFIFLLVLTVVVYVLRGFAVLSMLPGSVIWALILLTTGTGILAALQNIKNRY